MSNQNIPTDYDLETDTYGSISRGGLFIERYKRGCFKGKGEFFIPGPNDWYFVKKSVWDFDSEVDIRTLIEAVLL